MNANDLTREDLLFGCYEALGYFSTDFDGYTTGEIVDSLTLEERDTLTEFLHFD